MPDSLLSSAHRLARSRSSGRSLEVRGNSNPREMIIQAKREHFFAGQNPAYRSSAHALLDLDAFLSGFWTIPLRASFVGVLTGSE